MKPVTDERQTEKRGAGTIRRILVIKMSSLGDLFRPLPAVHALKQAYGAEIDWVTQPEYVPLVRCFRDVRHVIAFPRRHFLKGLPTYWRDVRRERYDLVLDMQGLFKSALAGRLARAGRRIGPSFQRGGARLLYDAVAGKADRERHSSDECMDVLDYLGLPRPACPAYPVAFPPHALEVPRPAIAVVPISRWPTKNWPIAYFVRAAALLQEQVGATVYLLGGRGDMAACGEIERALGRGVRNLAGRLSLVETGSVLAAMDLLIANDSGPVHLAAAAGVPVVVPYGATDPVRTGPAGSPSRVLTVDLPCRPCLSRRCRRGDLACLTGISPEQVVAAARELLTAQP